MTIGADTSPGAHQLVEAQAQALALAVAQPADAGRQPLEGDPLAGQADPAGQALVVGELVQHGPVGRRDVRRVARQRHPSERALPLAEQRAGCRPGGTRGSRRPGRTRRARPRPAGCCRSRTPRPRASMKPTIASQCTAMEARGPPDQLVGIDPAELGHRVLGEVGWDVAQRVVGAGLVGDDVGRETELQQARAGRRPRWPRPRRSPPGARPGRAGSARSRRRAMRPPRRGSGSRCGDAVGRRRPRCTARPRRSW